MSCNEEIELRQRNILMKMNVIVPLIDFCEEIEKKTSGQFSFMHLINIMNHCYRSISTEDRRFLISHIKFNDIKVDLNNPYITLLNLFKYFSKLIGNKIISPLLSLYEIAEIFDQKIKKKTIDFIYDQKLTLSSEINLNEFISKIAQPLQLDDISIFILFKSLDYTHKGIICLEDLMVVIDSYRDEKQEKLTTTQSKGILFQMIVEKNYFKLQDAFAKHSKGTNNRIKYSLISMEFTAKNIKEEGFESIISEVLKNAKGDDNLLTYNDLIKYLPKRNDPKPLKYCFKLTAFQICWLKNYLIMLSSVKVSAKDAFERCIANSSNKVLNLNDFYDHIPVILHKINISTIELDNIIAALDINQNKLLDYSEYIGLIEEAVIAIKMNIAESNFIDQQHSSRMSLKSVNSFNYYLFPVKGNMKSLIKHKNGLLFHMALNRKDAQKSKTDLPKLIPDKSKSSVFSENQNNSKDNEAYESINNPQSQIQIQAYDQTCTINYEDYQDDQKIIRLIEAFQLRIPKVTSIELLNHLTKKEQFNKQKGNNLVKMIDKDNDGYISGKDILIFFLQIMQHRSSIIAMKYIIAKITWEHKMTPEEYLMSKKINKSDIITKDNFTKLLHEHFDIELTIGKKLYEEIERPNNPPIIYSTFIQMLLKYKYEEATVGSPDFQLENISVVEVVDFERQIEKIVNNITDNTIKDYSLKIKNFKENLHTFLENNLKEEMTFNEYFNWFAKPLFLDISCGQTLFFLFKRDSARKNIDIIRLNDLLDFLVSFIKPTINQQLNEIDSMISQLEQDGPLIRIAFERVSFNQSGSIPVIELIRILTDFYPTNSKEKLTFIASNLDKEKIGMISYSTLQNYLNKIDSKFSFVIETKHIMSQIITKGYNNAEQYFQNEDFNEIIINYSNITKEHHDQLFNDLATNEARKDDLFEYMCNRQGRNDSYTLIDLINILNCYCINMTIKKAQEERTISESDNKESKMPTEIPTEQMIEEMMKKIDIGAYGKISMTEMVKLFNEKTLGVNLAKYLDSNCQGFISYDEFINRLRRLYGMEINLNITLVSKYIREILIQNESIENWILRLSKCNSIDTYISKEDFYSIFKDAFVNDQPLYEIFHCCFKETQVNNFHKINLTNFVKFILDSSMIIENIDNNYELSSDCDYRKKGSISSKHSDHSKNLNKHKGSNKSSSSDLLIKSKEDQMLEKSIDNKEDSNLNKSSTKSIIKVENQNQAPNNVPFPISYKILSAFEDNRLSIRNVIEMINIEAADLTNGILIKKEYMKTLLMSKLSFTQENTDTILLDFTASEDYQRFDLKQFTLYINKFFSKSTCDIKSILAKFKQFILLTTETNINDFIDHHFPKNLLKFIEMVVSFKIIGISIYECIIILQEKFSIDINQFLQQYNLIQLFSSKIYDPKLKIVLRKLRDYFRSSSNKERLFKKIDINNDGIISTAEFLKVINSSKALSLTEEQKASILNIIDIDEDGQINPGEFIKFLDEIKDTDGNDENSQGSYLPSIAGKKQSPKQPFTSAIIRDISLVKQNVLINRQALLQNKANRFLNYMVILQEDLIKNFYNHDCLENDFKAHDSNNDFLISYDSFYHCLKQKLLSIETIVYNQFRELSEIGLSPIEKSSNIINQRIDYVNFLQNLEKYNYTINK